VVDLPSIVAFQAPHDLPLGLALRGASRDMLLRCADRVSYVLRRGKVQGAIGVTIPAAIEAVSDDLCRGRFDGRNSAETGEGGLTLQALGVVFKATVRSVGA
jgi:hypothetical protein